MLYRKKPIIVEAKKFDGNCLEISEWTAKFGTITNWKNMVSLQGERMLKIETLEGMMTAYPGDWIIKGIDDEFYPCKADIFEKTYELVEEKSTWLDKEDE